MSCTLLHDTDGLCDWCGAALTGRRRRWCSKACNNRFVMNHRWTQAKRFTRRNARASGGFRCERCGETVESVEINHKVPCRGKHNVWGCHHHQDNLEALCRPCHLDVTREQREQGLL